MTAASLLALLTPLVLKWLIDQVLPRRETGLLLAAAGLIFLSYQGRTALTSVGSYLTLNAVQKMALRLRMDLVCHVNQLSADYYDNTPPGAVMYRYPVSSTNALDFESSRSNDVIFFRRTSGFK